LVSVTPLFHTEDVFVDMVSLANGVNYTESAAKAPRLFIALSNSKLRAEIADQPAVTMHGGDSLWLPVGNAAKITGAAKSGKSDVVLIKFREPDKNTN
jgi:hypothetical protein